jgi:hypothetical protein
MNIDKIYVIIGSIIIFSILLYFLVYHFSENFNDKKIVKYFGSMFCPHSRKGSMAYNLIKDFELEYKDSVTVEYYWSNEKNSIDEFNKASVSYVPTITSNNYKKIDITLPSYYDKTDKKESDIKVAYLTNIYNQIN